METNLNLQIQEAKLVLERQKSGLTGAFVRTRTAKQNPRCSKTKTGYYFMSNKLQETETGAVN